QGASSRTSRLPESSHNMHYAVGMPIRPRSAANAWPCSECAPSCRDRSRSLFQMIKETTASLFDLHANAIVNTVNCVGVMGKGVALEFKTRFPKCFAPYQRACKET